MELALVLLIDSIGDVVQAGTGAALAERAVASLPNQRVASLDGLHFL